jgi:hypothetical protein
MPAPTRTTRQPARAVARPAARPLPGRMATPPTKKPNDLDPGTVRAILAGLVALAVVATGFGVHRILQEPEGAPQAGCVIAMDTQGSAQIMRDRYEAWLRGQVSKCAKKARGVVDVVLATSETKTSTTVSVGANLRDGVDLTGNKEVDDGRVDRAINRLVAEVHEQILNAPRQKKGGTDLLGVTCVAADLLKGRATKTLIYMSDGMNASKPYRLRDIPLDDAAIAKDVDQARASGLLCRLPGVQVHMMGAGIGRGTHLLMPGRLEAIAHFWRAAFAAAGANLVAYQREP